MTFDEIKARATSENLGYELVADAAGRGTWIAFPVFAKTVSEANSRSNWRDKWARNRSQKEAAFWAALAHPGVKVAAALLDFSKTEKLEIRLRRVAELVIARRANRAGLDDDNLRASQKYIRDGIARALDVDDGDPRLAWQYDQINAPRGVCFTMVEIRSATTCGKTTSRRRAPSSKRSASRASESARSTTTTTAEAKSAPTAGAKPSAKRSRASSRSPRGSSE